MNSFGWLLIENITWTLLRLGVWEKAAVISGIGTRRLQVPVQVFVFKFRWQGSNELELSAVIFQEKVCVLLQEAACIVEHQQSLEALLLLGLVLYVF